MVGVIFEDHLQNNTYSRDLIENLFRLNQKNKEKQKEKRFTKSFKRMVKLFILL